MPEVEHTEEQVKTLLDENELNVGNDDTDPLLYPMASLTVEQNPLVSGDVTMGGADAALNDPSTQKDGAQALLITGAQPTASTAPDNHTEKQSGEIATAIVSGNLIIPTTRTLTTQVLPINYQPVPAPPQQVHTSASTGTTITQQSAPQSGMAQQLQPVAGNTQQLHTSTPQASTQVAGQVQTSHNTIQPLMSTIINPPAAVVRGRGRGPRTNQSNTWRGRNQQANRRYNGGTYGNSRSYHGQNGRGRGGHRQNTNTANNRNSYGKRDRSPSLAQNTLDKKYIKLDLEVFLLDNYGLKPSNPFTMEQLVNELTHEK